MGRLLRPGLGWHGLLVSVISVVFVAIAAPWGCSARSAVAENSPAAQGGKQRFEVAAEPSTARAPVVAWNAAIGESTFTLLGSVHVASAELYPLDERIEAAFGRSHTLVLELNSSESQPAEVARLLRRFAALPPGQRLFADLSLSTSDSLYSALRRLKIPPHSVEGMRPWYVATVLSNRAMLKAGFEPRWGIDEHFRVLADQSNRRIVSLETLEAQLSLLASLDPAEEEELLRSTLSELEGSEALLREALQLWTKGRADDLYDLMLAPMRREFPDLFEEVFLRRNRVMVERLHELSQERGHFFVVVGAGHLLGPHGIVDLLQSEGIVVRPLGERP